YIPQNVVGVEDLSSSANDSILIYDQSEDKYYRIISESKLKWVDEFGGTSDLFGDSVYTASQVLGVDSDVYIPVQIKRSLEEPAFVYEQYVEGTNALKNVTSYIFGDAFGFVRKINDSFGNLTFMYGYGDKTVNVKADGTLEYKNAALENKNSNGFYGDLQTAINFAENCGGWNLEAKHPVFKLAYVSQVGSGNSASFTYYFIQELAGEDIIGENGASLKITVEKGQVSNYVRHAVFATEAYGTAEDVFQAANAIASISDGAEGTYIDTALKISRIRTCYKPEEGALVPCWCIDFIDGGRTWIGLRQRQF
ncbi:MAG: hypothetical protein Q4E99_06510, partial [Bacillota bacterium]|nr:hypothetical protein [Bacillota bacterium]